MPTFRDFENLFNFFSILRYPENYRVCHSSDSCTLLSVLFEKKAQWHDGNNYMHKELFPSLNHAWGSAMGKCSILQIFNALVTHVRVLLNTAWDDVAEVNQVMLLWPSASSSSGFLILKLKRLLR